MGTQAFKVKHQPVSTQRHQRNTMGSCTSAHTPRTNHEFLVNSITDRIGEKGTKSGKKSARIPPRLFSNLLSHYALSDLKKNHPERTSTDIFRANRTKSVRGKLPDFNLLELLPDRKGVSL